jgi:hypothetical protein
MNRKDLVQTVIQELTAHHADAPHSALDNLGYLTSEAEKSRDRIQTTILNRIVMWQQLMADLTDIGILAYSIALRLDISMVHDILMRNPLERVNQRVHVKLDDCNVLELHKVAGDTVVTCITDVSGNGNWVDATVSFQSGITPFGDIYGINTMISPAYLTQLVDPVVLLQLLIDSNLSANRAIRALHQHALRYAEYYESNEGWHEDLEIVAKMGSSMSLPVIMKLIGYGTISVLVAGNESRAALETGHFRANLGEFSDVGVNLTQSMWIDKLTRVVKATIISRG